MKMSLAFFQGRFCGTPFLDVENVSFGDNRLTKTAGSAKLY